MAMSIEEEIENSTRLKEQKQQQYLKSLDIEKIFEATPSIQLELNGKKYLGEVHSKKVGEYIVFKVENVDDALTKFTIGYEEVSFKLLYEGTMHSFPTKVMKKKLPLLLLKFPFKEAKQVERDYKRTNLKIDTPLMIIKRQNDMVPLESVGMGTIVNISEGGCGINTSLAIKKGDRVNFFLEVFSHAHAMDIDTGDDPNASTGNEGKMLDLTTVVVNIRELTDGVISAGVEFFKLSGDIKEDIKKYMKRRLA